MAAQSARCMRATIFLAWTALLAVAAPRPTLAASAEAQSPEYLSPVPGSDRVLPETNIIIRPGGILDPSLFTAGERIEVEGSISGRHGGRLRVCDDQRTVLFLPDHPFAPGERVTVRTGAGVRSDGASGIPPLVFHFTIAGPEREALRTFVPPPEEEEPPERGVSPDERARAPAGASSASRAPAPAGSASLPPDFPPITASLLGNPAPGRIFLSSFNLSDPTVPNYLLILENDGSPFFYRRLAAPGHDFKLQPDGRLTYFVSQASGFDALDSTYAVVDSFRCGNGYATDFHESLVLPNGHAVLMSYDPQIVDMTPYDPKGQANAIVIGLVIQEIDREKDVVFQWRSWDHFEITDAIGIPLGAHVIDLVHGNSIDVDSNGDFLISSRNLNEITKVSRATGEILWRLGGKNNQFRFMNDPLGFSRQHAARWLPGGHLTLFDNGDFHTPRFSRAVEYELDEGRLTARLVWQYRHDPDVYGPFAGYVQRLPNGNTLVHWGVTNNPTLTEVSPRGEVVSELSFRQGVFSYRGFRFEWPPIKSALVELFPKTLNTTIESGWVTATIEPIGFDPGLIDVSTVRLAGSVPAEVEGAALGDANGDGLRDLAVSFSRAALVPLLTPTTTQLEVSGSLTTGERFHGFGDVTVITPSGGQTGSLAVLSRPGDLPVELALGERGGAAGMRAVAVYDVRGRSVRRWTSMIGVGGRIVWDGRRADGRPAGAGVYFLRVGARGSWAVARVVLTR